MRVTETRLIDTAAAGVQKAQARWAEAGRKVQTGVGVERPSQGLAAWAEGARSAARATMNQQRGQTIARSRERLSETDRVLGDIGNALSRVKELALSASNDTVDAVTRATLATEARTLRDTILSLANQRGPDGEYLLAGTIGHTAPFDDLGVYHGNGVRREVEVAEGQRLAVTVTGEVLVAPGGVDVFTVLNSFINGLDNDDGVAIRSSLDDLTSSIEQVANGRTDTGARMAALDQLDDARAELDLSLIRSQSRAVNVDAIEAASEMARSAVALEGARTVAEQIVSLIQRK